MNGLRISLSLCIWRNFVFIFNLIKTILAIESEQSGQKMGASTHRRIRDSCILQLSTQLCLYSIDIQLV